MKRFLRDEAILTVTGMVLVFWIFSTCTAVTGYTMADRSGRVGGRFSNTHWTRATDKEMRDVWQLPIILTVVWVPIMKTRNTMMMGKCVSNWKKATVSPTAIPSI